VSAPVDWLPDTAFVPVQAPDAVQLVALALDQLRVADAPLVIDVGETAKFSVGAGAGAGAVTVTKTEAVAFPPTVFEQVRLKRLFAVSAALGALPDVDFVPLHAPEAVQVLTFAEVQVSAVVPPLATVVGLALSDTVGCATGAPKTVALV